MYIYADNQSSIFIPIAHLTLSLSSFIFQVPQIRLNSKIIIWKELQLHNIIFTSRSAIIMIYSILCINNNIIRNTEYYYLYQIGKFALVILHHILADYITAKFNMNDKTTTRDINWENIPDNIKIWYGDDYIFKCNSSTKSTLKNFNIETEMSTTSDEKEWDERKKEDYNNFINYLRNEQVTN